MYPILPWVRKPISTKSVEKNNRRRYNAFVKGVITRSGKDFMDKKLYNNAFFKRRKKANCEIEGRYNAFLKGILPPFQNFASASEICSKDLAF